MYAVIETGGLQYRVEPGMKLAVPKLESDEGATLSFDRVLMVSGASGVRIGTPVVSGAAVEARVMSQFRGPKIEVFHRKRRKGYEKKTGHRQQYTLVEITDIREG